MTKVINSQHHVKKIINVLFALSLAGFGQLLYAAPLFSDNFDNESLELNHATFAKWTVSNGTVDLIGEPGFFDLVPGKSHYVDLDGSTNDAGKMNSSALNLTGGKAYTLRFDLAGSQRGDDNTVTYGIDVDANGILDFSNTVTIGSSDPFSMFSLSFTPTASTSNASIVFDHLGGDNIGILLDNVNLDASNVSAVPVPAAVWLFGSALLTIAGFGRKKLGFNR